jgi:hypothetical protein
VSRQWLGHETDEFVSATPLNHQFLTLTAHPASGLTSIPSVGDIGALRRTTDSSSSVNAIGDGRAYGDGESARYLLLDGEDEGEDGDSEDGEMIVMDGMKRMSVQTEGAAGPSHVREVEVGKGETGAAATNTGVAM